MLPQKHPSTDVPGCFYPKVLVKALKGVFTLRGSPSGECPTNTIVRAFLGFSSSKFLVKALQRPFGALGYFGPSGGSG